MAAQLLSAGQLFDPQARINNDQHWSHSEICDETEVNADIKRMVTATYSSVRTGDATTKSELETLQTSDPPLVKTPPGLKTKLKRHQGVALGRMLQWEQTSTIQGGILADEMGLGKTLTTLALILANPPAVDSTVLTTLIVAPANLIPVWKCEIEKHLDPDTISVLYAHSQFEKAQSFKMSQLDWRQVEMYDVVIASYECLQNEWKRKNHFDDHFAKGLKVPLPRLPFLSAASRFYRSVSAHPT
jgi:SNF2 family DNA or RNA helicase